MVKNSFAFFMRVLGILWMRLWFLLIPMRVLLRLENSISNSDMNLLVMMEALLLRVLIAGFVYSYSSPKIEENEKNLPSEESTDSKESQEPEPKFEEEGSSEDSMDSEDEYFMENIHYLFGDLDRNLAHRPS